MEQRINIQYSVTMGELEEEIHRLLKSAVDEIHKIDTELHTKAPIFSASMLTQIEHARTSMVKADIRLEEISKLINGYLAQITAPQPPVASSAPTRAEDLNGLKEKLSSFKEQLSDLGVPDEVTNQS